MDRDGPTTDRDAEMRKEPRCPVCGKPRVQAYRPFCSKRCADVDLGRWLSGAYVIAGEPADPEEESEG